MKTISKFTIAAIAGTTFMTLYSYWKSKKEGQEYVEPVMINKLIDKSENLPDIKDKELHPAGWLLHYATGMGFILAYWLVYRNALKNPDFKKITIIGAISGTLGIVVWKFLFSQHKHPPYNYRHGYYRQLLTAHMIFTLFAIMTYRVTDNPPD